MQTQTEPLALAQAESGQLQADPSIAAPLSPDERRLLEQLSAAADPVRLRILSLLREPMAVHEICARLRLGQPRASHHLAVLRDAGLVSVEARGRHRFYRWAAPAAGGPAAELVFVLRHSLGLPPLGLPPQRAGEAPGPPKAPPMTPSQLSPAQPMPSPASMEDFLL
jgi:ArsR family transcriptional regulator